MESMDPMASINISTRYTAADLFKMDDDARFELIEGELVEMAPPSFGHGSSVVDLAAELRGHIRRADLPLRCAVESGYLLARDPDTVLGPDISVVRSSDLVPGSEDSGYPEVVPMLVVEVVSPSNRTAEVRRKVRVYLSAGVPIVWIVNRQQRLITVHRPDMADVELRVADGAVLDGEDVLPGFRLPLLELFPD